MFLTKRGVYYIYYNSNKYNKISTLTASNSGPVRSNFGVYQQTSVESSEILMRTLVPDAISVEPYCKALITKLFSFQILPLSDTTFLSFSDLMTTVAFYFGSTRDPLRGRRKPLLSLFSTLYFKFRICKVSALLIFPGDLLRSRIPLIALRISLTLPFVLSFPLPSLIVVLRKNRYLTTFHSTYLSLLELLPYFHSYHHDRRQSASSYITF